MTSLPIAFFVSPGFLSDIFVSGVFSSGAFKLIESWAKIAVERMAHSLPEGLLIAVFAWAMLRVLPKQNSRTRFAVWFTALFAVVGLACGGDLNLLAGASSVGINLGSLRASELHLAAHWAVYLFIAWAAIAFVAMTRLALGLSHLRSLRRSCRTVALEELDPAVAATMRQLNASRTFASRQVALEVSDNVRVPSALGLWKPVIALPSWALAELPPSELSIILRHEFAHLRRWDDWTNLIQKMVRALFFFHPAVWWIESRLSVEREMACDDIVVAETDNPMGYANCLVSLLERSLAHRGWTMAQAIVHRAREASERVAQILDKNRPAGRGISKPALGLVGTFAALCVVMLPATPQFVAFDRGAETNVASANGVQDYSMLRGRVRNAGYREPVMAFSRNLKKKTVPSGRAAATTPVSSTASVAAKQDASVENREGRSASLQTLAQASTPAPLVALDKNARDQDSVDGQTAGQADEKLTAGMVLVRETEIVTADIPVPQLTMLELPHGPVMIWTVKMVRVTMLAPVWKEMPAKKI